MPKLKSSVKADMPCDLKLETGSELPVNFGFAAEVIPLAHGQAKVSGGPWVKDIPFSAAKIAAESGPRVR